jgi:dihydrofolate reductase / thymidylate synthase
MSLKINIIAALCNTAKKNKFGIGINNTLPWNLRNDLKHFKNITSTVQDFKNTNLLIMGKNTYKSIGSILPNRLNIVLSNTETFMDNGLVTTNSIDNCLDFIKNNNRTNHNKIENVFCIGGANLYEQFIKRPECNKLYLTRIYNEYDCDTFFPKIPSEFKLIKSSPYYSENNIHYKFLEYEKKSDNLYVNHEEKQYLDLMNNIFDNGDVRDTRSGKVYSLFGNKLEFDISNHFPLLTTRKIFLRGIIEELLWFIKGDTNANNLMRKNVNIWNGNTSRKFLDSRKLQHFDEGDAGAIYGHQWRFFGANYITCNNDYTGQGFDQLKECIRLIKEDPTSRRILLSAWNPMDFHKMSLYPCHVLYQWYVTSDGKLSCQFYQRSSDYFLANNFNICSASILTYMLAQVTGLKPGKLTMCIGDTHIYDIHRKQVIEQLSRDTKPFPKLIINKNITNINDFTYKDFKLINYNPHPAIKADMAV